MSQHHDTGRAVPARSAPNASAGAAIGAGQQMTGAVLAGIAAGIVMSVVMMAYMATRGQSVWTMPNLIAAIWMGETVAGGELGIPTLIGMLTHLATSALMGVIAIPFIKDLSPSRTVLVGFAYAVASYPVAFSAVISWANPLMMQRTQMLPMTVAHGVFGIVLALAWRGLTNRRRRIR